MNYCFFSFIKLIWILKNLCFSNQDSAAAEFAWKIQDPKRIKILVQNGIFQRSEALTCLVESAASELNLLHLWKNITNFTVCMDRILLWGFRKMYVYLKNSRNLNEKFPVAEFQASQSPKYEASKLDCAQAFLPFFACTDTMALASWNSLFTELCAEGKSKSCGGLYSEEAEKPRGMVQLWGGPTISATGMLGTLTLGIFHEKFLKFLNL